MSTDHTERRRKAAGTPVGGQFATEARTEPQVALAADPTVPVDPPAPIVLTYSLYRPGESRPMRTVDIDVTEILRTMPPAERRQAFSDDFSTQVFFRQAVARGLVEHEGEVTRDFVRLGRERWGLLDDFCSTSDPVALAQLDWMDRSPQVAGEPLSEQALAAAAAVSSHNGYNDDNLWRAALGIAIEDSPDLAKATWNNGELSGTFSTRDFDADLTDMPLEPWPGDGPAPSTDIAYGDSGALEMTFEHGGREFRAVYDEYLGPTLYDGDTGHTVATDGQPETDEDFYGLPAGASRWAMSVYSRASHVESAVRYAALASARDAILDAATGAVR